MPTENYKHLLEIFKQLDSPPPVPTSASMTEAYLEKLKATLPKAESDPGPMGLRVVVRSELNTQLAAFSAGHCCSSECVKHFWSLEFAKDKAADHYCSCTCDQCRSTRPGPPPLATRDRSP